MKCSRCRVNPAECAWRLSESPAQGLAIFSLGQITPPPLLDASDATSAISRWCQLGERIALPPRTQLGMKFCIRILVAAHIAWGALFEPLNAQEQIAKKPTPAESREIREKSLQLLHESISAPISGKEMQTVEHAGNTIYFGDLFDSSEVTALVNLAPEKPRLDPDEYFEDDTRVRHLSYCVWKKDHWEFRQYIDNAGNVEFHKRKGHPRHFIQASRRTGRFEGDHLSWYYERSTKRLVRTNFEFWGPFYLVGNYLCATRGFERRAMDETVWVFSYRNGKKGELLARYDSDIGRGELRNFSVTFRERKSGKYWTYSFNPREAQEPYLHYNVDAVEGEGDGEIVSAKSARAEITLAGDDVAFDEFCFERLTGLSRALLNHTESDNGGWEDELPKLSPLKAPQFKVAGVSEIVRHLQR